MLYVDIGITQISVVEIVGKGKSMVVKNCKIIPVDKELITSDNNVFGENFSEFIEKALADREEKAVSVTFSCLPVISNDYVIPFVKDKLKMNEMIKSKVFQTLSPNDYLADYIMTDVFIEDNVKKCNVTTYVAPKNIVQATYDTLKSFDKVPVEFSNIQHIALRFANTYMPNTSIVLCVATGKQIILHLVNNNHIVTRTTVIEEGSSMDVLSGISGGTNDNDISQQIYNQISKLVQYQAIKYAGESISGIYLIGEHCDNSVESFLSDNFSQNVQLISKLELPFKVEKSDISNCFYSICSSIK